MFGRHRHHFHHRHGEDGRHYGRHGFGFHGGFDRMERGRHGRHGRPGRFFEQGDLRFLILSLIADNPAHGYEIIKAIEERTGGAYAPSPGVVYPTLTLLEELGFVSVEATSGSKKLYTITPEGEAALAENKPMVDAIQRRLAEVEQRFGGGPDPKIVRAMENLRTALKLRMGRGPLTEQQVADVAAALDAAARTVEES